jgi:CRP-like cAMP-binding protein
MAEEEPRRVRRRGLRSCVLFRHISASQLDACCAAAVEVIVEKGDCIVSEGDEGSHIFVVERGLFEAVRGTNAHVSWGRRRATVGKKYGPHDHFGEMALLYERSKRAVSVRCVSRGGGVLWSLSRTEFLRVLRGSADAPPPLVSTLVAPVPSFSEWALEPHREAGDNRQAFAGKRGLMTMQPQAYALASADQAKRATEALRREHFGCLLGPDGPASAAADATSDAIALQGRGPLEARLRTVSALDDVALTGHFGRAGSYAGVGVREHQRVDDVAAAALLTSVMDGAGEDWRPGGRRRELALTFVGKGRLHHALREARILAALQHTFIVGLVGAHMDSTHVYQLLELPEGRCDLRTVLSAHPRGVGEDHARFYLANVLLALSHLDGGAPHPCGPPSNRHCVAHRELRPESLLLDGKGYLKLSSFGNARQMTTDEPRAYTLCGTNPGYMAPEMLLQIGHGTEVDLWALGVLTFELLHGERPFERETPPDGGAASPANVKEQSSPSEESFLRTCTAVLEQDDIRFDRNRASGRAITLIGRMLVRDPTQRANAAVLRADPFFDGVPWQLMLQRAVPAPLVPQPPVQRTAPAEALACSHSRLLRSIFEAWRKAAKGGGLRQPPRTYPLGLGAVASEPLRASWPRFYAAPYMTVDDDLHGGMEAMPQSPVHRDVDQQIAKRFSLLNPTSSWSRRLREYATARLEARSAVHRALASNLGAADRPTGKWAPAAPSRRSRFA